MITEPTPTDRWPRSTATDDADGPVTGRDRRPARDEEATPMLQFGTPTPPISGDSLLDRPDLRIGNLLDDPRLRRAMGLDAATELRPARRFDRRRLLDDTAAA